MQACVLACVLMMVSLIAAHQPEPVETFSMRIFCVGVRELSSNSTSLPKLSKPHERGKSRLFGLKLLL